MCQEDREIEAMKAIAEYLSTMTEDQAGRVLEWAADKYANCTLVRKAKRMEVLGNRQFANDVQCDKG